MERVMRTVFVALVCAVTAMAQATYPLKSISVTGNKNFSDRQLIAASGLRLGGQYTRDSLQKRLEEAQAELLASGVVESVAFLFGASGDGSGYAATFEVAEIQQVYPILFLNFDVPEEEIRAYLGERDPLFAEKIPGTDTQISRYARFIEDFLKAKGEPEPVQGELSSNRPDELIVMFHPRGAMPVIAEVAFEGNEVETDDRLREAIHGVAVGTRYSEGRFRTLLTANLLPVYAMRGRIDVQFPELRTERAGGGVNGVRVIATVDEGESYSFGIVRVEGSASMNRELASAAGIEPGGVANIVELETGRELIKDALRGEGYMAAEATEEHRIDREKKVVDVVYFVEPGPKYKMGELHLQGLDLHGEHEIGKVWGMKPGDDFDATYPEFFLQRIKELNLFDGLQKTASQFEPNHETGTVDVTLFFNPRERKARFGGDDPLADKPQRKP